MSNHIVKAPPAAVQQRRVTAPPVSRHPEYYNVMHALNDNRIGYRYLMDIFHFQPQTWRDDEAVHMIKLGYAHYERRTVWALVKE